MVCNTLLDVSSTTVDEYPHEAAPNGVVHDYYLCYKLENKINTGLVIRNQQKQQQETRQTCFTMNKNHTGGFMRYTLYVRSYHYFIRYY